MKEWFNNIRVSCLFMTEPIAAAVKYVLAQDTMFVKPLNELDVWCACIPMLWRMLWLSNNA
jgi:hypothetical protein